ncbi:MAG: histidine kinase [Methylococcaceae bacterium]|nr:histidine kinase [Methylococcaceae bacterium]
MKTVSLRTQINIRIVVTSAIILIFGGIIAIWQARQSVKTELDSSLNLAAQLIQINFHEAANSGSINANAWLPRFVSLEQTRHLIIEIRQPDGQIVNFSGKRITASEVQPPHWFIALISAQSPKIEQQLTDANGEKLSLIIQADPIDEIGEAWQESRMFFATLLMMTLITFIAVNLLFNKSLMAITVIVDSLKAIEQGHYRQKLPEFSTQEYDNIARAINHMTGVLDDTHRENKALTLHTLQIQEEERQHLAKELHDELGQSLTAIKIMAATAKADQTKTEEIAHTIISVCDHLITVVRSMMRNLHPLVLTELGLKASLEDLLNHWSQRYPQLALTLQCPDAVDRLKQNVTIQVFRIVQECLTNIIRHANAHEAKVTLEITTNNVLRLIVSDYGQGCSLAEMQKGFGLLGMRERVKSLDGELAIKTEPNQGMTITADIPIV